MIQKTTLVSITLFVLFSCTKPVQKHDEDSISAQQKWQTEVEKTMKLFGHRNWIVVADAAYPKQSNPAIQTITVDANQLEVVRFVNELIDKSKHVDANIFVDKEMAFVAEKDANGIENYRANLNKMLEGKAVKTMLHEDIIRELDASAKVFDVLIIKTDLAIPYTSVFFQLNCGYWTEEAEKNMRINLDAKQ